MHTNNTPKAAPTSSKSRKRLRVRSDVKAGGTASWGNTGGTPWWGFGGNSSDNT